MKKLIISPQKGIVSLTFLFFFTGILITIFWLNDDLLLLYQKNKYLHQQNVEIFFEQQKMTEINQLQHQCERVSSEKKENVLQIFSDFRGRTQGRYCGYLSLFKKDPKRAVLMEKWAEYIHEDLFNSFSLMPTQSPLSLSPLSKPQIYYLDEKENLVQLNGKVWAILLVNGNLTLQGDGELRGIVITKGKIHHLYHYRGDVVIDYRNCSFDTTGKPLDKHCLKYIRLIYDKKINYLKESLGRWQLGENSWHDFEKQSLRD